MLGNWHAKNRANAGDIPQPAATERQRTDVCEIPGELIPKKACY